MAAGLSVLSAFTVAVCLAGRAEAHEPPFGTGVYTRGAGLVLRMSRGLVLRSPERLEYRLLCNEALGVAEYGAPSVLVREDGSLLVGSSEGLKQVSADGCAIEPSQALGSARISALAHDPHDSSHVYAATDLGLHESRDHGEHFAQLDEHLFDSLEVRDQVFAAGKRWMHAYVARWHGAAPLELQELALEPHERGVALLGSDDEHVLAVARAYLGTPNPDRLLVSADGARSWQNLLSAPGIAAFAVDARRGAWLLGDARGMWRTSASGETAQLGAAAVSCLAQLGSTLYICDGSGAEGGVSRSDDGGEHTRSLLRWNQVAGLVECPAHAPSVQRCQAAWEDWARELPQGPPLHAELDELSSSAGSCAAVGVTTGTHAPLWIWIWVLAGVAPRLYVKRSFMTKPVHTVILALVVLAGCGKDAKRNEEGSTRSDAGPRARRDSGTPLEPNQVEDAAMSGSADSGPTPRRDAGRAASDGGTDSETEGTGGRPAAPSVDAGARPRGPSEEDAGSAEPDPRCTSCGGCEEMIKVVSTMHTNTPVTYPDPPPTSGPHNPCWGRWGVHDEPLRAERWVHNLEHGGVVFLYNCPDGCDREVAALKQLNRHRHRTIISAYAELPTRFGVVSWGHRLLSDCFDLDAFDAFYLRNFDHAPESNANPPNPDCPP